MHSIHLPRAFAVLLLAATTAACDNPVQETNHHEDPAGVVIRSGSIELIRVVGTGVPTGNLTIGVGAQTPELTVVFIAADGDELSPDEDYHLRVTPANTNLVTWQSTGAYTGRLTGVAAGATTLEVALVHGPVGGGHAEGSYMVPITITATQP